MNFIFDTSKKLSMIKQKSVEPNTGLFVNKQAVSLIGLQLPRFEMDLDIIQLNFFSSFCFIVDQVWMQPCILKV